MTAQLTTTKQATTTTTQSTTKRESTTTPTQPTTTTAQSTTITKSSTTAAQSTTTTQSTTTSKALPTTIQTEPISTNPSTIGSITTDTPFIVFPEEDEISNEIPTYEEPSKQVKETARSTTVSYSIVRPVATYHIVPVKKSQKTESF